MSAQLAGVLNTNKRHRKFNKKILYSWEMILVYLLITINIAMMAFVPEIYFGPGNLQTIIRSGLDISIMVLGMAFILILGEIDVSVASIMLLSSMVMGYCSKAGMPAVFVVFFGIVAGAACGAINGILVSLIKMPSVIATIGTSILFRGIVRIVLQDGYLDTFPAAFSTIAWYDIGGFLPLSMLIFLLLGVVFCIVLHRARFGRELYIIGNNRDVANYSGIRVAKTKIIAFIIMGITAALSGIIFVGRLGGITFSMANGYELKVIAIVVLGGVSTLGGKGRLYGPIIATFIMALLTKALDLFQIHPNVQKIAVGVILIAAVLIPRLNKETFLQIRLRFKRKNLRTIEGVDMMQNVYAARRQILQGEKPMTREEFNEFIKNFKITTELVDYEYPLANVKKAKRLYKIARKHYFKTPFRDKANKEQAYKDLLDAWDIYNLTLDRYHLKLDALAAARRARKSLIKLNTRKQKEIVRYAFLDAYEDFKDRGVAYPNDRDVVDYVNSVDCGKWVFNTQIKNEDLEAIQNKYYDAPKNERKELGREYFIMTQEYIMGQYYLERKAWCEKKVRAHNKELIMEAKKKHANQKK